MGLYNIVNQAGLQAGQPEDISVVLANLQAVQTILNGGIDNSNISAAAAIAASKLAGYPTDATKALFGDGTWKVAGYAAIPKITVSTWAGGPPASPSDGDIWIATAVDAASTRWSFQYNAGSASALKWELFAGTPVLIEGPAGEEGTASLAYVDLGTVGPSYTISRASDSYIEVGAYMRTDQLNSQAFMSYAIGAAAAADADAFTLVSSLNARIAGGGIRHRLKTGIAAATAIVAKYRHDTAIACQFGTRRMRVLPLRIS